MTKHPTNSVQGTNHVADVMARALIGELEILDYGVYDPGTGAVEYTFRFRPTGVPHLEAMPLAEQMMLWWGTRFDKLQAEDRKPRSRTANKRRAKIAEIKSRRKTL